MIADAIKGQISHVLESLGYGGTIFVVEHPAEMTHGDYSTNAALLVAKEAGGDPRELAKRLVSEISKALPEEIDKVEVADAGFINFFLSRKFFTDSLKTTLEQGEKFGKTASLVGKKAMVEYTDPNPFKEFHIGHLMSNTIGEAISRLVEWSGAEVRRACYQGDVGIHVAKAVAEKLSSGAEWSASADVARSYTEGSRKYEEDVSFREFANEVNRKIYAGGDRDVHGAYDLGKKLTLEHFEKMYKTLGTKFDFYFFESRSAPFGKKLVEERIGDIFEESDGAIVFRGERHDAKLHTRVFLTKDKLPTYEAKELGLAKIKYDLYPYDLSIVITGNEVSDYFKVVLKAMELVFPDLAKKTNHISHGMLRLPTGKMSSRTGEVVSAEWLIEEAKRKVNEKIEASDREIADKNALAEQVAVAAIKYSILKQSPGKDIIFDFDKSLSFEGDSGPYLQYTHARANSILEKANEASISPSAGDNFPETEMERLLYRFPEIVERAEKEFAPNIVVTFLVELAGSFNHFYAQEQIVDVGDKNSPHKVALSVAVRNVLKNGLKILGISAPERM